MDKLQCGQTHSRDLRKQKCKLLCHGQTKCILGMVKTHSFARRRRSEAGASRDPTPTAAVPFNGKKPCRPIIAARMTAVNEARQFNWVFNFYKNVNGAKARTRSNTPRRLPEFLMIYSARLDLRITRCEEGHVQLVKLMQICEHIQRRAQSPQLMSIKLGEKIRTHLRVYVEAAARGEHHERRRLERIFCWENDTEVVQSSFKFCTRRASKCAMPVLTSIAGNDNDNDMKGNEGACSMELLSCVLVR